VGFLAQLQTDMGKRYPKPVDPRDGPQPPGRFSFGTQTQGGPAYTDAFRSKRGPSQNELVENYCALVYAMVSRNSDAVAKVPFRLMADGSKAMGKPNRSCDAIKLSRTVGMRLAGEGKVSSAAVDNVYEIRNHPLLDVLDNPDPYGTFTREKLIKLIVAYMDVVGSAYIVPEGNGWDWTDRAERRKGPPENLWVVYPQWVIPTRTGHSPIVDTFVYFSDRLPYQSVLWFRHSHSLRDAYGSAFSPTYAGEAYRQQESELVTILSQVMAMPPRPSLVMTAKDALIGVNPTQKQALEQQMRSKFAAYGAGGLWINDGSWEVTPVDYQKADVGAKDIAQHDRDNLASIFGQPPTYYTVDTNVANLTAADAQFAKFSVEPRCGTVAAMFTRLAKMSDPRLFVAHDPVMPEDDEMREKVFTMQLASGRVTINQVNEEEKYPPVAWGNEPWLPSTLTQPSMAMATHEQSLKQADQQLESGAQADELAADGHEHQKQMDKEGLAIDKKKAAQKPAAKRSLQEEEAESLDEAKRILREIDYELMLMRSNPNHVASGDHGGEFASGGGAGGAAKAHGKHWAKRQRRKAKKRKPGEKRQHKPTAKAKLDRLKKGKSVEYKSVKAQRAADHQTLTTGREQKYTKANESAMAARIGGESFADNGAVDITVKIGKQTHGIELKTLVQGKNDKVTMAAKPKPYEKESAIDRKVKWQNENGTTVHTVVADHRDKFAGGENKELHSGNELYYKRGTGSFRIGAMHPVKDIGELHTLMKTPYDKLPKKAQGDQRGGKT
jgi:Phage portal protein